MIRQPTADPYAWWRRALRDPSTPRHEEEPQAGFYRRRAVRGGPWLPVEIWLRQVTDEFGALTEPEVFEAEELGQRRNPERLWLSCRPVSEDEYHALIARHRTVAQMAATHAPIDLALVPILPGE